MGEEEERVLFLYNAVVNEAPHPTYVAEKGLLYLPKAGADREAIHHQGIAEETLVAYLLLDVAIGRRAIRPVLLVEEKDIPPEEEALPSHHHFSDDMRVS